MTLDVEFSNGGNTESLTVYVGNFVDVRVKNGISRWKAPI